MGRRSDSPLAVLVTTCCLGAWSCTDSRLIGDTRLVGPKSDGASANGGPAAGSGGDKGVTEKTVHDFITSGDKYIVLDGGNALERFSADENQAAVDLAIIIDTSDSMTDEIDQVQGNLGRFLESLDADARTRNIQLFVLAGFDDLEFSPPAGLTANPKFTYEAKNHEVTSFNLLGVAKAFLSGKLETPKLELRKKAAKHMIFITDDDAKESDSGNPPAIDEDSFRKYLESSHKDDEIHLHGIVCKSEGSDCVHAGESYMNLARDKSYQGSIEDLTSSDWSAVFSSHANAIMAATDYHFKLSHPVKDVSRLEVYVDGEKLTTDDWRFMEADGILVVKAARIDAKAKIVVAY